MSVLFYYLVVARFLLSNVSSAMEQADPSSASSAPLDGRFLRLSLDLASDQLYDLANCESYVCYEQSVYSSGGSG